MQLTRQYKNASGDDLRFDMITLDRKGNTIASKASTHTFKRNLKTQPLYNSNVANRVVAEIEIIGDFSSIETSSNDYLWAKWDSPIATLDMSDLPGIGDTV